MGIGEEIKTSFKHGTSLTRLIYVNAGVFLIIKVLEMISVLASKPALAESVVSFLSIPAAMPALLAKPWTLITYMFVHQGFVHLLFNMLWLWWFGKIFLTYLDQRKLVAVYFLGGIAGGLLYVAVFNIFPAFAGIVNVSMALGASASVMAMVVTTAVWLPEMELHLLFLGRIKLKYLALIIFLITSVFDFSVNTGGKLAHIGGALLGLAYGYGLKNGTDIGAWFSKTVDFFVTLFKPRSKLKVTYRKPRTDFDYNAERVERQKAIDHILDKISKGGYDSLTREEKDILFRESQKKN